VHTNKGATRAGTCRSESWMNAIHVRFPDAVCVDPAITLDVAALSAPSLQVRQRTSVDMPPDSGYPAARVSVRGREEEFACAG